MKKLQEWIADLYECPDLLRMGHLQRAEDLNLGLGWLYYALARIQRCKTVVVIGSYRGFVPLVLARALADNQETSRIIFIEPSYVDDFWKDKARVEDHFTAHGLNNIDHFLMTTEEFTQTEIYQHLDGVGLLFIDGYHTEKQARYDHEAFADKLSDDATILFHDSVRMRRSRIYGEDKIYEHTVVSYMRQLEQRGDLQVFDLPFDSGVTLVRRNRGE